MTQNIPNRYASRMAFQVGMDLGLRDKISRSHLYLTNICYKPIYGEAELILIDQWNASMVPDKMKRVRGDFFGRYKPFGRFAVVRELQEMEHIRMLLLENGRP